MRTCTVELYTYDELTTEAQTRARDAARSRGWFNGDDWEGEWRDTLIKGADALDLTVGDWSVGLDSYTHTSVTLQDDVAELAGVRAWKYLQRYVDVIGAEGSCPFTGYCGDESFLDPLRAFLKRPDTTSTVQDIMEACATSWANAWLAEMEYQITDESVADSLTANEYEFTEVGYFH